jgi:hypothetical protein
MHAGCRPCYASVELLNSFIKQGFCTFHIIRLAQGDGDLQLILPHEKSAKRMDQAREERLMQLMGSMHGSRMVS